MDRDSALRGGRANDAPRQERDADSGRDAAEDAINSSELQCPLCVDSARREKTFKSLAIRTAGSKDDDPQVCVVRELANTAYSRSSRQDKALDEYLVLLQLGVRDRPADEGAMEFVSEYLRNQSGGRVGGQRHVNLRVGERVRRENRRQPQCRRGFQGSDHEWAHRFAFVAHSAVGVLQHVRDSVGVRQQSMSSVGQLNPATVSGKQRRAEFTLKLTYLPRDVGLNSVQFDCGPIHTA